MVQYLLIGVEENLRFRQFSHEQGFAQGFQGRISSPKKVDEMRSSPTRELSTQQIHTDKNAADSAVFGDG